MYCTLFVMYTHLVGSLIKLPLILNIQMENFFYEEKSEVGSFLHNVVLVADQYK